MKPWQVAIALATAGGAALYLARRAAARPAPPPELVEGFEGPLTWAYLENDPIDTWFGEVTEDWATEGIKSYRLSRQQKDREGSSEGEYCQIGKQFDLTDVHEMKFDWRATTWRAWEQNVLIDDEIVWTYWADIGSPGSFEDTAAIDLSPYTGVHTLKFRHRIAPGYNNFLSSEFLIDNIRFLR